MSLKTSIERTEALASARLQLLTFSLCNERYGVDILRVQEIRGWASVTRLPQAPAHVLGVLNLRGSIVPIMDLRVLMGLPQAEVTPLTVVVVLAWRGAENLGCLPVGLMVDAVSDVIDVGDEELRRAPCFGHAAAGDLVREFAASREHMLVVLDADELLRRGMAAAPPAAAVGAA